MSLWLRWSKRPRSWLPYTQRYITSFLKTNFLWYNMMDRIITGTQTRTSLVKEFNCRLCWRHMMIQTKLHCCQYLTCIQGVLKIYELKINHHCHPGSLVDWNYWISEHLWLIIIQEWKLVGLNSLWIPLSAFGEMYGWPDQGRTNCLPREVWRFDKCTSQKKGQSSETSYVILWGGSFSFGEL